MSNFFNLNYLIFPEKIQSRNFGEIDIDFWTNLRVGWGERRKSLEIKVNINLKISSLGLNARARLKILVKIMFFSD